MSSHWCLCDFYSIIFFFFTQSAVTFANVLAMSLQRTRPNLFFYFLLSFFCHLLCYR